MNDRLRVRIWDKSFRKMLYNNLILCYKNKITAYDYLDNAHKAFLPESHIIIEQCTGLKDKNGNLIYEGDIVKFKISSIKCVGAVRRDERTGGWLKDKTGQPLHTYIKSVEVIGNIHENPELLEGK